MTLKSDELRLALDGLGIKQTQFARLLGVGDRAVRRWVLGEREVPPPVELLVKLLQARPELLEVVDDLREQGEAAKVVARLEALA